MREPDACFAEPGQAVLYDALDGERDDLEHYRQIAVEVGARRVLDVGCGTGSLAVLLAGLGFAVTGLDPAGASLDVARSKPGGERVDWVHGDATALRGRPADVDLAVMTGNVAQVFVTEEDWHTTLRAIRGVLRPGGWLVFETRRPQARAWEGWSHPPTPVPLPDGRTAAVSMTVTEVALPLVTFTGTTVVGEQVMASTSTLRFRDRPELEADLDRCGFDVVDVREAPDRPGLEMVVLARAREDD